MTDDRRPTEDAPEWAERAVREIESDADSDDDAERDSDDDDAEWVPDVPRDVADEAERLTRLARNAVDPDAADSYRERRDSLAADYDYTPRVRDADDTLVLYPSEWVADGEVQFDRIERTDRAVERGLSGPGDAERYEAVVAHNDTIVRRIREEHGEVHADNVRAFADFMENHYVRELDRALPTHREEFLAEYFPRNVWPSEPQEAVVERSLALIDCSDPDGSSGDS